MNKIRKWAAGLLAVIMVFSVLTVSAGAYTKVDTTRKGSLEMTYMDTERSVPLSGMSIRLYKVADMSDAVRFQVTDAFKDASVFQEVGFSLYDLDAAKWSALAETLSAYVAANKNATPAITPAASGTVGSDGKVKFENLEIGLYLLDGDTLSSDGYNYTPTPFLLTVPTLNVETDEWVYDITAENKVSRTGSGGGGTLISRNVLKVWNDNNNEDGLRPDSITVQLLADGAVYSTVELSEANNWRHSWISLEPSVRWQLVEVDVPEEYQVLVELSGNTFVVTNSYTSTEIPPETPPGGEYPPSPPEGEYPPSPPEEELPDEDPPLSELPQTGVMWWPVPLLAVGGLMLLLLGLIDNRNGKKNRDEA